MLRAYLELLRPANVVTALADVLAGYAIAGAAPSSRLAWLLASTACLYAGGVVLNDVFDRRLDATERPERPIPSGRASAATAATLGAALLGAGVLTAAQATAPAAMVAAAIVALVVIYDALAKRHSAAGPIVMGTCRGLNLLLGIAAAPAVLTMQWPLAVVPFTYIVGVTVLSRGEVHGGAMGRAAVALALVSAAVAALFGLAAANRAIVALPIAVVLAWAVLPRFRAAVRRPAPAVIRHAVNAGVLSLVLLDATLAATYSGMVAAIVVLALSVVAAGLSKLFAVT